MRWDRDLYCGRSTRVLEIVRPTRCDGAVVEATDHRLTRRRALGRPTGVSAYCQLFAISRRRRIVAQFGGALRCLVLAS
jgi:hypothetical protein